MDRPTGAELASERRLDAELLEAHARDDREGLVRLYADAARLARRDGRTSAEAFYLTHAYVYALASGDPASAGLHRRLAELGSEE